MQRSVVQEAVRKNLDGELSGQLSGEEHLMVLEVSPIVEGTGKSLR